MLETTDKSESTNTVDQVFFLLPLLMMATVVLEESVGSLLARMSQLGGENSTARLVWGVHTAEELIVVGKAVWKDCGATSLGVSFQDLLTSSLAIPKSMVLDSS